MFENYTDVLKNKYATVEGRASRREYWLFVLANFIISLALTLVSGLIGLPFIASLYALAVLVPGICVGIRRLHDTGKSGWWMLLCLTGIGSIVILIFYCIDSDPGTNVYGPNPKYGNQDEFNSGRTQISWHSPDLQPEQDRPISAAAPNVIRPEPVTAPNVVRAEPVASPYNSQPEPVALNANVRPEPVWVPEDDDLFDDEKTVAISDEDMTVSLDDDEKTAAFFEEKPALVKLTRLIDNKEFICYGDVFSVGKSLKRSNYAITENEKVSRKHAEFHKKDGQYYIVDSSKNGTRVNGYPAEQGNFVPLNDGDRIEFADEGFIFNLI